MSTQRNWVLKCNDCKVFDERLPQYVSRQITSATTHFDFMGHTVKLWRLGDFLHHWTLGRPAPGFDEPQIDFGASTRTR